MAIVINNSILRSNGQSSRLLEFYKVTSNDLELLLKVDKTPCEFLSGRYLFEYAVISYTIVK